MGKVRSYKVNDEVYDIPDNEINDFIAEYPDAIEVQTYIVDKDTFDIPLNEVQDFESQFPKAKKKDQLQPTPSKSSAGSLQSQDDVFSQLQSNIQGKPQDFVVPAGFEAKKGKVIPKKQEEAIKFAGEQFQASSNIKRAKKDFESANFKQAKLQREIEDKKAVGDLQGIDDLIVRHDNEVQNIQNAQNIFATETERLNKVNDYFIKAAKINQLAELKKQKELAEEPAIIEVGKQFYNAILPPIVKGVGVATSAYGAFLDEFKGDPTEYNTLGDYIMDAGKNIIQGGESLKAEVSKKADKSIFKDEGYKDPRAYVNTMISGLGSIVQMGIGAELGVPMMVTGSLSAADGLYDGAKESGLSEKQSLGFAITLAPFVGALEEVGGNTYVKDFTKKAFQLAGKETAKKLVGKELTTDMVVKAFGETLKDKGVDYVKQVGKGVGLETLTGAGETAAQITGETIFDATIGEGKQKGEGAFGRDVTKPGFFSETAIEIAQGGIEEGIGALLPVAVAGRRNIGKERLYKDILKAKTDPTGINGWYNMIDVALQEGKINETQHAQAIQSIEEATNIVKRIPEKIDNPSAVMETVDLLTELDNKREEINKADDAFSGVLKNEAEEIEVKLKQILETNEPTQPIEYDIKDRTGVPGEERIGEEPIEAEPKQSTSPEEIKAGGVLQAPTEEQIAKDVRDKNFVTFTYGSESDVPERFKDKISSSGEVNGKKQIKVTLPKSVADYEINRQKQIDTITDLLRNSDDNKFNEVTNKYFPNYKTVDDITEEYYNAKENGSNPELVKAVEDLLGKKQEEATPQASGAVEETIKKPQLPTESKYKKGDIVIWDGQQRKIISQVKMGNETKFEIGLDNNKSIWTNDLMLDSEAKKTPSIETAETTKAEETIKKPQYETETKKEDGEPMPKRIPSVRTEREGRPESTELRTEKEEIGSKEYKQNTDKQVLGRSRTITIADGSKIKGQYKIVNANDVLASHNEETFSKTKNFPVNEQGKTVNDRDYETDTAAQSEVIRIANNLDSRAVTQTPIVTKDGIIVDGNNRTMSRKLAAKLGTDTEYLETLKNDAEFYGIDPNEIDNIQNPMLVFESEQDIPYTTKEFARFNKAEKKEKSPIEKAVELSKTISDRARRILSNIYEEVERPSDVTSNPKTMSTIRDLLLSEGIIQTNEIPRYISQDTGTATKEGVAFLETLLIGSSLDENTIRLLNADNMGVAKNRVLESIVQITQNASLKENSLQKNIEQGVKLLHKANTSNQTVLEAISQMEMFDVAEYSSEDLAVAILLDGKGFKAFLKSYNAEVGTESIFEGTITKESIIDNLLKQKIQNYEQVRKNLRADVEGGQAEIQEGDGADIEEKNREEIAKRIRNKKQGGAMSAIDFGLSRMVYNGALEFMAKQVEKGTKLGNAIAKTMKWIDEQMEGKKWDKGAFAKYMNDEYKVKLGNGEVVDVVRDDTKETAEVINGFYLPIEQKILDTKQESMPANKWAEILKSKEDEDLYTGVREFLESRGTSTVTKQELKDFIKNNRIEIVEVIKGVEEPFQGWSDEEIEYHLINQMGFEPEEVVGKSRHQMIMLASEEADFDYEPEGNTKYHQYQLPGEKENYKEVLITLPSKENKDGLPEGYKIVKKEDYSNAWEGTKNYVIVDYDGYSVMQGDTKEEVLKSYNKLRKGTTPDKNIQFKSSHFTEPNILVHLRMNTRKDAEGNKVLFLEEVQSDWGQEGKKKGFVDSSKSTSVYNSSNTDVRLSNDGKYYHLYSNNEFLNSINKKEADSKYSSKESLHSYLISEANRRAPIAKEANNKNKIPTAPFVTDTNSWVRLGLKYALKQAVEQGADKLAWTTGEQQNERYDLSKQVDEIVYFPTIESGVYDVTVLKNDREILSKQMDLKEIESTLGKDIAEKIQKGEGVNRGGLLKDDDDVKSLMGLDLKVGGKGMKGFYGSAQEGSKGIIGGVAEKLFGQKVGTAEIQSENFDTKKIQYLADKYDVPVSMISKAVRTEDLEHQAEIGLTKSEVKVVEDFLKGSSTQPSIDITPEIKQYVKEGMPLFKGKEVPKAVAPQLSQEQIVEQGNKLEEIFNLEKTRDSKKSESVKEDFQKEIDKIAETLPKDLVEKAKFVKQNLGNIRTEMEKKNLLKVEC